MNAKAQQHTYIRDAQGRWVAFPGTRLGPLQRLRVWSRTAAGCRFTHRVEGAWLALVLVELARLVGVL